MAIPLRQFKVNVLYDLKLFIAYNASARPHCLCVSLLSQESMSTGARPRKPLEDKLVPLRNLR